MKYRDVPCDMCGWKFQGFHVCVDLTLPEPELKQERKPMVKTEAASSRRMYDTERSTPEWKAKIKKARQEQQVRIDESHADRNGAIIKSYQGGASMREIAQDLGIDYRGVMRVLHIAKDKGLVTIRPPRKRRKDELCQKKTLE